MPEARAQTAVALVVVIGSFAIIILSLIVNRPIPADVMTLITVAMGAVLGWYFGVRGAATGAATVNAAHANTVAAVAAATGISHDQAVRLMTENGADPPAPAPPPAA